MSLSCRKCEDKNILQPAMIFDLIGVKNTEDANKVFSAVLSFLLYLPNGARLETSSISVQKITNDLLVVDTIAGTNEVLTLLNDNKLIKLPL